MVSGRDQEKLEVTDQFLDLCPASVASLPYSTHDQYEFTRVLLFCIILHLQFCLPWPQFFDFDDSKEIMQKGPRLSWGCDSRVPQFAFQHTTMRQFYDVLILYVSTPKEEVMMHRNMYFWI